MRNLAIISTLLFLVTLGILVYHLKRQDQDILLENSNFFTERIRLLNEITDLKSEIDKIHSDYEKTDSASMQTDTVYITIKRKLVNISPDSNTKLLSRIFPTLDSAFQGYYRNSNQ
jgi:hypothetical protein